MRLIDADYVKKKTLNAITMVEYDMRNAVAHGDDEEYYACENQKSAYTTSIKLLDHAPTIEAVPVQHGECLKKLQSYENAEEQGLLLRLPCKVGDTFFEIESKLWSNRKECYECRYYYEGGFGEPTYCGYSDKYGVEPINCFVISEYRVTSLEQVVRYMEQGYFGKTVFLTKTEAEAALERMKGEEHEIN